MTVRPSVPAQPAPACADECAAVLLDGFRERGVDATVSWLPQIVDPGYEQLSMRCPHGVLWFAEPTSEQIAEWVAGGIA